MIENNLIEYVDGDNKFKTTQKGLNFLKMHNQIERIITDYNKKSIIN